MKKSTKRFLVPVTLVIILFFFLIFDTDEYSELSGAISTVMVFVVFPLSIITLFWAIIGKYRDRKLETEGIPVSAELFPAIGKAKEAIQEDQRETQELSDDLKKRKLIFRIWGVVLAALGLVLICCSFIIIGTLILIGGGSLFFMSSPKTYSDNVDGINMIPCPPEYTLDRIYEDFRNYKTIYGSVCRGTTFPNHPALFWRSADSDWLFYIYKPEGKNYLYMGSGANIGCKMLSEPVYPPEQLAANDFQDALCFQLEYHNFAEDFSMVLENYLKTGRIASMPKYQKGTVYFFEESFKLSGQRFHLLNSSKETVYTVEGTYPLKTLQVFDRNGAEIFRMTKELVRALPNYLLYENGTLIGEFSKNFDLVRDSFTMQTANGTLEMHEINTLPGSNYMVTMNSERIGMIAEQLNLTIRNLVFDNMVMTVYDDRYLPLVTALGVMAVREMARDADKESMNSD